MKTERKADRLTEKNARQEIKVEERKKEKERKKRHKHKKDLAQ